MFLSYIQILDHLILSQPPPLPLISSYCWVLILELSCIWPYTVHDSAHRCFVVMVVSFDVLRYLFVLSGRPALLQIFPILPRAYRDIREIFSWFVFQLCIHFHSYCLATCPISSDWFLRLFISISINEFNSVFDEQASSWYVIIDSAGSGPTAIIISHEALQAFSANLLSAFEIIYVLKFYIFQLEVTL